MSGQQPTTTPSVPSVDTPSDVIDDTMVIDRVHGENIAVKEETVSMLQTIGEETGESLETIISNIKQSIPVIASVEAVYKMIEEWGDDVPSLTDCIWGASLLEATLEQVDVESMDVEKYPWTEIHVTEAKELHNHLEEMIGIYEENL